MHNGNWFAVSRMIFDHHVVGAGQTVEPADPSKGAYSKMEAWLWLIANAMYEPKKVVNKGREMELQPGQLMGAYSYLAQQWNWTPETVRWFIKRLELTLMITRYCSTQKTSRYTNQAQVLSICNYERYQITKHDEPQPEQQAEPQAHPKRTPSAQHESNNKQITLDTPLPPKGGQRGTRLPKDWVLPLEWRKATIEQFEIFDAKVTTEANSFRDYWTGLAGQKAVKVDWQATWRNWIRKKYPERLAIDEQRKVVWWQNPAKLAEMTPERWRKGIAEHANGIWPVDKLGPPPGSPKCVVPPALISELRLTEIYTDGGIKKT